MVDYQLIIGWSSTTDSHPQSFHLQSTDNRYSAKNTWGTMQRFPAGASYSSVSKMPPRPIKHPTPASAPPVLLALEVSWNCGSCSSMALGISLVDQPDPSIGIRSISVQQANCKTWNHQKPPAMNSRLPPACASSVERCQPSSAALSDSKPPRAAGYPQFQCGKRWETMGKQKRGCWDSIYFCVACCVFFVSLNYCYCSMFVPCVFFPVGVLGLFWC